MTAKVHKTVQGIQKGLRRVPSRTYTIAGVLVFAAIGTALLVGSHAATPTASFEPESGTLTTGASVVGDATASGSSAVQFSSSTSSNCTDTTGYPAGFPNNCNTGYQNAPGYPGSLTTFSGSLAAGQTYRYMKFSGGVTVNQPNVTFIGCQFTSNSVLGANVNVNADNVTFSYSTFMPSAQSAPRANGGVDYGKGFQYGINQNGAYKMTIDHSDF